MSNKLKIVAVVIISLIAGVAFATLPHTFSSGNTLTASKLMDDLNHLESGLRGGTHTAIVNADISGSAGIAHSKLATPTLVPKAWAYISDAIPSIGEGSGVSAVARPGVGNYNITLSANPANTVFAVIVTPMTSASLMCTAHTFAVAAPHFQISCQDDTSAATSVDLMFTYFDL